MEGGVPLSIDVNVNKGYSEIVDSWPLMGSPIPVFCIVASYLTFVLCVGPWMMKSRPAFQLKNTMLVYNVAQVIMSLYVVNLATPHIMNHGIVWLECFMEQEDLKDKLLNGLWLYFFIKITELLDTIFFILRKKDNQVSFLHVYHHSILVTATWVYLKYTPTEHIIFIGFINSFVHVVMYTYYGLSALGPWIQPYLFWKKYITTLQLIQFVMILFQIVISYYVSDCPPHILWVYFFVINTLLFIYLFSKFYRNTYIKPKKTSEKET